MRHQGGNKGEGPEVSVQRVWSKESKKRTKESADLIVALCRGARVSVGGEIGQKPRVSRMRGQEGGQWGGCECRGVTEETRVFC